MQEFEVKVKLNRIDAEIIVNIEAESVAQAEMKMEEEILSEIVSLLDYAGYNYEIKQRDDQMEKKIMEFLKGIGSEYEPWREDQVMIRKLDQDFDIEIDGVRTFFDGNATFDTYTLIEVVKYKDDVRIDFRTHHGIHQTSFTTIDLDKLEESEWRINGEYYYPLD